jgi:uncharacterized membrane protein YoaK (UPF0700 family)
MAAAPTHDLARWRVGLFKVLAALFVVFQLFNIGNLLAPWDADPALALTGLAAPDTHLWHAALPGAVRLLLTGGVAAALLVRPASKPLLVQWLILSAAITVVVVVPFAGLPPLLFIVLPTVLVVAAYPWPSKLANLRVTRVDRPLAALTTLTAAALAPSLWQNLTRQLDNVGGEHATEAHWALDAAHVLLLLAAGALASTRRTGWQTLAILTGVTFLYLGVAAIAIPEQAGSWGTLGGALGVLAGVAYLIAGMTRRSSSQPVESRPFGPPITNQDA